jgi:membrane protein YqaA with SNARE-associated domain
MGFLKRLGDNLLILGIPGMFLIAFLDSAAVPMVGGPDAILLLLCWQRPLHAPWTVLAAALGSTCGCFVLYQLGRAGRKLMSSRESGSDLWVLRHLDRHAFLAILIAVMAPPPFPTKAVILAAGITRVSRTRFALGVLSGRLARYGLVGYLGARFGNQGMEILKSHYGSIALALGVLVLLVLAAEWVRRSKRPKTQL